LYSQSTNPSQLHCQHHQQLVVSGVPSKALAPLAQAQKVATREKSIKADDIGFFSCPHHIQNPILCLLSHHPSPSAPNTHKTILITNLPQNVTIAELLSKVRGGKIVWCRLMATTPITVSPSAMLRFLNEDEALAYDDTISSFEVRDYRLVLYVPPAGPYPTT
jgi:hypothetical protein